MNLLNVILSVFITSIAVILSILNLSNVKLNLKTILKFTSIFIPIMIIACLYLEGISKITITIFSTAFALYISLFDRNASKSIYYSIVYEILAFIIEVLICFIEILIFKFDQANYENFKFAMLLTSIINTMIIYFITKIEFIKNIINKYYDFLLGKRKEWIYIFIVIIMLTLLVSFNGYNLKNSFSFYVNIAMFIFVLVSSVYLIYNSIRSNKLETKYNDMIEYLSKYEKIINEQGKKNHEYNNQLMVLRGYLDKPKKLKEYLNLIIEDHKCGQNYMIKQLSYFPDGGIKGLIYDKLSRMEELNIVPYLYIDSKLKDAFEENLDINTYKDVTKLLGVFLDNAIDAAKDADKKEIELDIKREDKCLIVTISNTYNKDVDVSKIGKKGFSTKGIGHGFGLSIVKDISKTNENIETFSNNENDKFKQTIIIYYK